MIHQEDIRRLRGNNKVPQRGTDTTRKRVEGRRGLRWTGLFPLPYRDARIRDVRALYVDYMAHSIGYVFKACQSVCRWFYRKIRN